MSFLQTIFGFIFNFQKLTRYNQLIAMLVYKNGNYGEYI